MITVLGLSMVAILAGRIPIKGIASAGLGLMVGTIGEAAAGGSLRMATYDIPYLIDGLTLVIVGLGIFAIPEIVALLRHDRTISRSGGLGAGWLTGVRDWWANIFLSIRCSVIGVIVGVIPGLGGSVVDWIAYGHAVQSTKDKSKFGSGDVRGVIGPESSNNAKEGGGLVPTLIFGIPGSGSMAVFLGGLALLGIDAGPQMITNNLDVTYTIVWSLAIANVLGAGLCIALSTPIARLTTIRFTLLAPFLLMMIAFAAFQSRQDLGDLVALFSVGLLGIFLRRFDWSRPAFLIGFVLSHQAENFSNMGHQVARAKFNVSLERGFEYVASPIVLIILALTVISIIIAVRQAQQILPEGDVPTGKKRAPLIFLLLVTLYLAVAWVDAMMIGMLSDKIFPVAVSSISLVCCLLLLIRMMRADENDGIFADREAGREATEAAHGLWGNLAWFAGLLVLSCLLGFILALAIFLVSFMRVRAGLNWAMTLVYAACGLGFMIGLADILNRDFPPGLLQNYVELPWPFV
jgi:putative tricarboxylic transport membrane protein